MAEKILVVEDETALRETLEYNLKRQGYEVHTAADGRVASHAGEAFRGLVEGRDAPVEVDGEDAFVHRIENGGFALALFLGSVHCLPVRTRDRP